MISCHIVRPVVWRLIVELDQCTVCQQNTRHHRHPNRNTRADHQTPREHTNYRRTARKHNCCLCHTAGRNRQILPVYGLGTRVCNVASREVMSGSRLCIPGTNVSTPSQPLISVEMKSICRMKTDSFIREWLRVAKQDPVSWSWRRQTPVLMRLMFPLIANLTTTRNTIVVTHIDGTQLPSTPRLALMLQRFLIGFGR